VFKGSGFYRTDSRGKPARKDGGDKAKQPAETASKASSDGGGSTPTAKAAEKSA
jgi:predicted nucleic acid-binding Zn ribbon protein